MQTEKTVLNAVDVSVALGISRSSAYALMRTKQFPSFVVGKKMIRVYKRDFERYIEEVVLKK